MCVCLSRKTVRVRKLHPCEWCPEPIRVGDQATHYVGTFEGEFQSWYMHPECLDAFYVDMAAQGETCMEIAYQAHQRGSGAERAA